MIGRNDSTGRPHLFNGWYGNLPRRNRTQYRWQRVEIFRDQGRATLHHINVISRAATSYTSTTATCAATACGSSATAATTTTATTTALIADTKRHTGAAVNGEIVDDAVGDWTWIISNSRAKQRTNHRAIRWIRRTHTVRQSKLNGKLRGVVGRNEHAPFAHKRLHIRQTQPSKSRTHIVGFGPRSDVGSFRRILPRNWIAPHGQTLHNGQGIAAARRQHQYIVLRVEIGIFGEILIADVRVRNFREIETDAPPTFGLRAAPVVHERNAGRAQRMHFYRWCRTKRIHFQSQFF